MNSKRKKLAKNKIFKENQKELKEELPKKLLLMKLLDLKNKLQSMKLQKSMKKKPISKKKVQQLMMEVKKVQLKMGNKLKKVLLEQFIKELKNHLRKVELESNIQLPNWK